MEETSDWIFSLRQQVEALARRNEIASSCTFVHNRTKDMDQRIVRMRELLSANPTEAAKYYVECAAIMDETDRIVRRTTRRRTRRRRIADMGHSSSFTSQSHMSDRYDIYPDDDDEEKSTKGMASAAWWKILCLNGGQEVAQKRDDGVRNLWKTQIEFFLTSLGFIVGVGNTLRFPAKVYQHGGGVFFIPYITCMICFGLPIVYMHLCIGQFSGLSPSGAFWKMMPIASGLGWALVLLAVPVCIYYNVIVAWAIYYFWFSFRGFLSGLGLPWDRCEEMWVSRYNCCDLHNLRECFNSSATSITAPEAYFHFEVLNRPGVGDFSLGPIQAHLVLALAVAWIAIFFAVFKGIGSIGWTVSVTATVPYLLLTILFLRGTSLPGAEKGLRFLFTPNLDGLWSLPMWKSAAEQVFYELGIDAGPLIAMASFSRYRNNIYRDACLLVLFDALTSVLCGMVIFSFIGFLAHMSGSEVNDVLQHDPLYLSFTVYPGVTSFMHLGPLWAALFFGMLALSALDAEFAWLEMIASSLMFQFNSKDKRIENRILAFMCIFFFICGLPLCARGGIYIFHSIESLNANWNSFSLGLMQMILVCFIYGVDKFIADIGEMIRISPPRDLDRLRFRERLKFTFGPIGPYVKWAWSLFCPCILTALLVASAVSYERVTFEKKTMPWGYELVAWVAMVGPLFVIPFTAFYTIYETKKNGRSIRALFSTANWKDKENDSLDEPPEEQAPVPRSAALNGYTYIDPQSRQQSTKSYLRTENEEYGRRTGRITDFWKAQALMESHEESSFETVNTYGAAAYGQSSPSDEPIDEAEEEKTIHELAVPTISIIHTSASLPLFGSPPISVINSAANSIDLRPRLAKRSDQKKNRLFDADSPFNVDVNFRKLKKESNYDVDDGDMHENLPTNLRIDPEEDHYGERIQRHIDSVRMSDLQRAVSEALAPPQSVVDRGRCHSAEEYGIRIQKLSISSLPSRPECSRRSDSEESVESECSSSSSNGRPQRPTVIRRFTSSDSLSIAQSSGSISITPLDQVHHRSMSSVAIFDEANEGRKKQPKLSQLKRPKPIDAPSSVPSPSTSHF